MAFNCLNHLRAPLCAARGLLKVLIFKRLPSDGFRVEILAGAVCCVKTVKKAAGQKLSTIQSTEIQYFC